MGLTLQPTFTGLKLLKDKQDSSVTQQQKQIINATTCTL